MEPGLEPNTQHDLNDGHRTILISGAGIAGLASALFLTRAGYRVEILEQAPKLDPIGSGLQLSPNAMHVLAALGLEREVQSVSTAPTGIDIRNGFSGRTITRVPLGEKITKQYGQPYLVIHRGDLQKILYEACQREPDIQLRMGVTVRDAVAHPNGITIIADSENGTGNFRGVGLIGADGVNSVIRNECFECKGPIATGTFALRALIEKNQMPDNIPADKICMWLATNAHAVVYLVRGGAFYNVVLTVPDGFFKGSPGSVLFADRTTVSGRDIAKKLGKWHKDFTHLLDLDAAWTKWPLMAAPHLRNWSEGNITLVGDAAHAMTPHAAQGAAQGLEDAAVLGAAVNSVQPLELAFEHYQKQRIKRAYAVRSLSQKKQDPLPIATTTGSHSKHRNVGYGWHKNFRPPGLDLPLDATGQLGAKRNGFTAILESNIRLVKHKARPSDRALMRMC